MKYNYRAAIVPDVPYILEYIENEINILDFDSRKDLAATLYNDLWFCDRATIDEALDRYEKSTECTFEY
jgi:hypothetical protein